MITEYFDNYVHDLVLACRSIDSSQLEVIRLALVSNPHATVLVMGNGGSAAIAEHLTCDWMKGVAQDQTFYPRVRSLTTNTPLITALANDFGYQYVFAKQIEYNAGPAIVIAISSSGNSDNILHGLRAANAKGYDTFALVGFDGGIVKQHNLAQDGLIHVKSYDYGVVEDTHSIIMHTIAQYLRC